MSKRLALYFDNHNNLIEKVIDTSEFNNNEEIIIPFTCGWTTLQKHTVKWTYDNVYTELFVEKGKENLLNNTNLIADSYRIFSKRIHND